MKGKAELGDAVLSDICLDPRLCLQPDGRCVRLPQSAAVLLIITHLPLTLPLQIHDDKVNDGPEVGV